MRGFLRFYWRLIKDIPAVLRSTAEAWVFWGVSVLLNAAALFNQELARLAQQPGFSRWYVLVPVLLTVLYGMMRVNYKRFQDQEHTINTLRQETSETYRLLVGATNRAKELVLDGQTQLQPNSGRVDEWLEKWSFFMTSLQQHIVPRLTPREEEVLLNQIDDGTCPEYMRKVGKKHFHQWTFARYIWGELRQLSEKYEALPAPPVRPSEPWPAGHLTTPPES